jgi:RNA polymerase sigma factor (sigma-70 family)
LKYPNGNEVRQTFDSYCKKVLKYTARNHYAALKRQGEREVPLSGLSQQELSSMATVDVYSFEETVFDVQGDAISVHDDDLADALKLLSQDKRDIVLLSYFTGLTDREIAGRMDMARRTVAYRRASSLRELKKRLEEIGYE